jgi:hypothetical protein
VDDRDAAALLDTAIVGMDGKLDVDRLAPVCDNCMYVAVCA